MFHVYFRPQVGLICTMYCQRFRENKRPFRSRRRPSSFAILCLYKCGIRPNMYFCRIWWGMGRGNPRIPVMIMWKIALYSDIYFPHAKLFPTDATSEASFHGKCSDDVQSIVQLVQIITAIIFYHISTELTPYFASMF